MNPGFEAHIIWLEKEERRHTSGGEHKLVILLRKEGIRVSPVGRVMARMKDRGVLIESVNVRQAKEARKHHFRLYALADGIRQFLHSQTQGLRRLFELQGPATSPTETLVPLEKMGEVLM